MKPKVVKTHPGMGETQVREYVKSITTGEKEPESKFEKSVVPALMANIQMFEKTKNDLAELEKVIAKKKANLQSLDGGINTIIGLLISEENKRLNSPMKESKGE